MRVFVVGTGRTGSLTLAKALEATVTNFSVGHETQSELPWERREYPDKHIEVDHRLSFYLSLVLSEEWGPELAIVHLQRELEATVASWARRFRVRGGMMRAWTNGILFRPGELEPELAARDYVAAVRANVDNLVGMASTFGWAIGLNVNLARPASLRAMWDRLELEGDRSRFLELCKRRLNASPRYK